MNAQQVDDLVNHAVTAQGKGWHMSFGTTHLSKSSEETKPLSTAAALSDVTSLWAFFAIFAALSYPIYEEGK